MVTSCMDGRAVRLRVMSLSCLPIKISTCKRSQFTFAHMSTKAKDCVIPKGIYLL